MWSNSATTSSISGLNAGTYVVTVTDSNVCNKIDSVLISEPSIINLALVVDQNASCNGSSDGGASVTVSGGTLPYTYLWSTNDSTST